MVRSCLLEVQETVTEIVRSEPTIYLHIHTISRYITTQAILNQRLPFKCIIEPFECRLTAARQPARTISDLYMERACPHPMPSMLELFSRRTSTCTITQQTRWSPMFQCCPTMCPYDDWVSFCGTKYGNIGALAIRICVFSAQYLGLNISKYSVTGEAIHKKLIYDIYNL